MKDNHDEWVFRDGDERALERLARVRFPVVNKLHEANRPSIPERAAAAAFENDDVLVLWVGL